jgi:hypothetical protein
MARFLLNKQAKGKIQHNEGLLQTEGIGGLLNAPFGALSVSVLQDGRTVAGIDQYFRGDPGDHDCRQRHAGFRPQRGHVDTGSGAFLERPARGAQRTMGKGHQSL